MKKIFKYSLIGTITFIVLVTAFIAGSFYRIDLMISPLSHEILSGRNEIRNGRNYVPLIPKVFYISEEKSDVIKKLEQSGYKAAEEIPYFYEDVDWNKKVLFFREANMNFCNSVLYVTVEFDIDNRLVSAEGTKFAKACL